MSPLIPNEGWHVLHLFYHIDHSQWSLFTEDEQRQAKVRLTELIQEIRATPDTQLLTFSIVSSKASLRKDWTSFSEIWRNLVANFFSLSTDRITAYVAKTISFVEFHQAIR